MNSIAKFHENGLLQVVSRSSSGDEPEEIIFETQNALFDLAPLELTQPCLSGTFCERLVLYIPRTF